MMKHMRMLSNLLSVLKVEMRLRREKGRKRQRQKKYGSTKSSPLEASVCIFILVMYPLETSICIFILVMYPLEASVCILILVMYPSEVSVCVFYCCNVTVAN